MRIVAESRICAATAHAGPYAAPDAEAPDDAHRKIPARKVDAALSAVGLERLGDPLVTTLSGGEFQRLLLARALIDRPNLLVLDEPAQGVDMAGAELLEELVDGIRQDLGCGVLMISHDVKDAVSRADDVIVLVPHEHDPGLPAGAADSTGTRNHHHGSGH